MEKISILFGNIAITGCSVEGHTENDKVLIEDDAYLRYL